VSSDHTSDKITTRKDAKCNNPKEESKGRASQQKRFNKGWRMDGVDGAIAKEEMIQSQFDPKILKKKKRSLDRFVFDSI